MSHGATMLAAWQTRWRFDDIEDALDDLEGALDELVELARGDKHPGSPGTLAMEIDREQERAEKAVAVLTRAFTELQAGAA